MNASKKKHILVISQYFYPEQFRINDICLEWIKRGFDVTVVTGIPNYPQGDFYDGYDKKHRRKEKWKDVNIIRLPLAPRKTGSINLVKNYLSFVWSGFWWKIKTKIKADYVFCFETSPMTQALIAVWYAKKHKVPCYMYVQDLWPENVEMITGIHSPLVMKPIGSMVNYIYKHCDHIWGTSPSFVKEIQKRCKKNKEKVSYWPQYAEDFYVPVEKKEAIRKTTEISQNSNFKVCFTGNIGKAQGLEILPKAAKLLNDYPVEFVIVGDGRDKEDFLKSIKENSVENMFVLVDRQPATRIPEILGACDAAFISFTDNDLFSKTIPAKLQSYMACGMPVIASATGETERIINSAKCGLCSKTGDEQALADNIREMLGMNLKLLSENSRSYFESNFDKEMLMNEIQVYFE